jgi:hypothetical protein
MFIVIRTVCIDAVYRYVRRYAKCCRLWRAQGRDAESKAIFPHRRSPPFCRSRPKRTYSQPVGALSPRVLQAASPRSEWSSGPVPASKTSRRRSARSLVYASSTIGSHSYVSWSDTSRLDSAELCIGNRL